MSIAKIIVTLYILITFILAFVLWKYKRLKKYEDYGALLLFMTTIFGFAFLCFDKSLISTEHEDLFYYIELIVYVVLDLIALSFYLIKKIQSK